MIMTTLSAIEISRLSSVPYMSTLFFSLLTCFFTSLLLFSFSLLYFFSFLLFSVSAGTVKSSPIPPLLNVLRKSALKDLPLSVLVCQVRESAYVLVCIYMHVCVILRMLGCVFVT